MEPAQTSAIIIAGRGGKVFYDIVIAFGHYIITM